MNDICIIKELYMILYKFEKDFLNRNHISINEAMVLCFLKDKKSKKAGEIKEYVGLSNSRMSKVLSEMEEKKLIERKYDSADKRVMLFIIKREGISKMEEINNNPMNLRELINRVSNKCRNI